MLKHVSVNQKSAVFIHPGSVYVDKVKLLFLQEELSQALWSAADTSAQLGISQVVKFWIYSRQERQSGNKDRKKRNKFLLIYSETADSG